MEVITWIGYFGCVVGVVTMLVGAYALCGKLWWIATWKWGDAKEMRRSVRLGWNAGEMPEGKWVLVREHADGAIAQKEKFDSDYRWALMMRRGDRCYSINSGYSTPITNISGWLLTVESTKESP